MHVASGSSGAAGHPALRPVLRRLSLTAVGFSPVSLVWLIPKESL